MKGRAVWVIAVLGLVVVGAVVWSTLRFDARSVVLITIDTLRPDRIGAYGYEPAVTPTLDALARDGVLFETAYCDIPWTTGSMSTVMTGYYGPSHRVRSLTSRLSAEQLTLAEILKSEGFRTGAVVGSFPLDSVYGLDQGFESYDDALDSPIIVSNRTRTVTSIAPEIRETDQEPEVVWPDLEQKLRNDAFRSDAEVTERAIEWLLSHRKERGFLWVHYFGPHEKLTVVPERRLAESVMTSYDTDVTTTDTALNRFLGALDGAGLGNTTLVILHSDHGQEFFEHGQFGHGHSLTEPVVRIPLIMRLPGKIRKGSRVQSLARTVDLLPTILDYVGLEAVPTQGRSLRDAINGDPSPSTSVFMEVLTKRAVPSQVPALGEVFAKIHQVALRHGRWKYTRTQFEGGCLLNPTHYGFGMLALNPVEAFGATPLDEDTCKTHFIESLVDVHTVGGAISPEDRNQIHLHRTLATAMRDEARSITDTRSSTATDLELTDDQRDKLESLGYLQ